MAWQVRSLGKTAHQSGNARDCTLSAGVLLKKRLPAESGAGRTRYGTRRNDKRGSCGTVFGHERKYPRNHVSQRCGNASYGNGGMVGWLQTTCSPTFWLGFMLFAGFFTLLFLFLKKLAREGREAAAEAGDQTAKAALEKHYTKTTAGTDHHEKKNWVGIALGTAGVLFLVALTCTTVAGFHSDHNQKVEESLARQRLYRAQEDAARMARIPAPRSVTPMLVQSGTTSSTASAPSGNGVVWKGLKNPTKYAVVFTNDMWSPRIPRPPRMAGRLEPNIRPVEVRVSRASDPLGTGRLYRAGDTLRAEDAFLEYRFPENTNVVSVTIGIGFKAN